uniref:Uncharacterized protein n=1 Tax=Grammatophora oceanica TaxID=210454 RepID=A0A7S1YB12_9STRA|mmetsp:Transcript_39506/g.58669  ORF Transcript_39506/g.58669 Transcript_39506/m.58669 type:complete len:674 (+) Transcript_39506:3-2024(+)
MMPMPGSSTSTATTGTTTIGRGGVGGAAVEVGHRYADILPIPLEEEHARSSSKKKNKKKRTVVMEDTDDDDEPDLASDDDLEMGGGAMTARRTTAKSKKKKQPFVQDNDEDFIIPGDLHPEHLNDMYPHRMADDDNDDIDIVEYFEDLGCQAGEAALGVDVFVIVEAHDMLREKNVPYGLPFLKLLAERSGSAGPVLLRTDRMDQLTQEMMCRVPWKEGMAFGGVLRLRCSPGFDVDPSTQTKERSLRDCPQLAPSYVQKGLMGVGMASVTDELGLWQLGTLDTHTTVVVDLLMKQRKLKKQGYMEGMGEVALKSGFQMCLAYTSIEKNEGDGQYYTVLKMRVATFHAPITESSEMLYAHLDPEALLVVFYHKLALVAYAGGLEHVQEDSYQWLQSFLSGVYHSGAEYAEDQQETGGRSYRNNSRGNSKNELTFHTNDRTLDEYGNSKSDTLSRDDILLGFGHEPVSPVVLLTWSLMQSDAFRPSVMLSSDARVAAMGQMARMMASELSRCVAPRLELWIGEERVVENVDLSLATIQMYLEDLSSSASSGQQQQQQKKQQNAVLVLDSPAEIIVCHAGVLKKDGITISRPMKPITPSEALMEAVDGYVQSYQVPPKVYYCLEGSPSSAVAIMDRWRDYFLEDSVCALGSVSFGSWKKELAAAVGAENGVLLGE